MKNTLNEAVHINTSTLSYKYDNYLKETTHAIVCFLGLNKPPFSGQYFLFERENDTLVSLRLWYLEDIF